VAIPDDLENGLVLDLQGELRAGTQVDTRDGRYLDRVSG